MDLNLIVVLKTVHYFCNFLCRFVARVKVKYISQIGMERAPVDAHRAEISPNTFVSFYFDHPLS